MYISEVKVPLGDGTYKIIKARFPHDPEIDYQVEKLLGFKNYSENASSMNALLPAQK